MSHLASQPKRGSLLVSLLAVLAIALTPALAVADDEGAKDERFEILPVDLDVAIEFLRSDTVSSTGWRVHGGYVGEIGRTGNWSSFFGVGALIGGGKITEDATESVEHRKFGGLELRLGGAYVRDSEALQCSTKLLQAHLFVNAMYAGDAIEEGGLTYRAGVTASLTTLMKLRVFGLLMEESEEDHQDKGLGVALGLFGGLLFLAMPTTLSLFIEDTASDNPARYGLSFGWAL